MTAITATCLEAKATDGSLKVTELRSWIDAERANHEGKLTRKDSDLLEKLIRNHRIKAPSFDQIRDTLRETSLERGYKAVALRARRAKPADDGWPVDSITNGLDLNRPLELKGRNGLAFRSGCAGVANLHLNVRKIFTADGKNGLELHAELRKEFGHSVADTMLDAGATFEEFTERWAIADTKGRLHFFNNSKAKKNQDRVGYIERCLVLRTKDYEVHYFPEEISEQALRGGLRVRGFGGNQASQRRNLKKAIRDIGATEILEASTTESRQNFLLMRLLWQADPRAAHELGEAARPTETKLKAALKRAKVPPEAIDAVRYSEVFPGYFTGVAPGMSERYVAHGARALAHSAESAGRVCDTILSGGLISTTERLKRGILVAGSSSDEDLRSGGADYVFTRLLTGEHDTRVDDVGNFVFVMKPKLLDRTDWFGYAEDNFGSTSIDGDRDRPSDKMIAALLPDMDVEERAYFWEDFVPGDSHGGMYLDRPVGKKLLLEIADRYYGDNVNNELMFRAGIPLADVDHVVTSGEADRIEAIRLLRSHGVTRVNGRTVEDFVQHREMILPPADPRPDDGCYV